MGCKTWRAIAGTALLTGLMGCNGGKLPGHYWELDLSTSADNCNASTVGYSETLDYRLQFGIDDVTLAIDGDSFAAGSVEGCRIEYSTITWTESRADGDIQWRLDGEAIAQREEGSCGIGGGWQGTETFTVVSSEDPAVRPGCEYIIDLAGTYEGEVTE